MARIRTIKPEFWQDEKLAPLDPLTRLVFLGLVSQADDAGRLLDNVKMLDGLLFPETDDSCRQALDTLASISRVTRYRSESGQRLIQINNWGRHQKVDRPSRYSHPGPTPEDLARPYVTEVSRDTRETLARHSRDCRETLARHSRDTRDPTLDLGPTTNDLDTSAKALGADAPSEELSFDEWKKGMYAPIRKLLWQGQPPPAKWDEANELNIAKLWHEREGWTLDELEHLVTNANLYFRGDPPWSLRRLNGALHRGDLRETQGIIRKILAARPHAAPCGGPQRLVASV